MKTKRTNVEKSQLCSICIANYNGEHVLADCLDSLFSQQGAPPFEVIVHDDASTDGSIRLLREHYPEVVVIESKVNVGFCISNNRMVDRARGEYVLLLNNDAALMPYALATLLEHARQQTPRGILTLPQYDWRTGHIVDRGCLLDPFYNPVPNLSPDRHDVAMVIGACLWLPRRLWHKIGGFPEWMGSIAEDMYLCCIARLLGYPVQVTKSSGYRHWQGMSFSGKLTDENKLVSTSRRRSLTERNKTLTMLITCPGYLLPIIFPMHLATLCFEGIIVTVFGGNQKLFTKVYLQLPRFIWQRKKYMLQVRKQVQNKRVIKSKIFLAGFKWIPWKLKLLLSFGVPIVR
jgi:GT2 family glycosyltransferase